MTLDDLLMRYFATTDPASLPPEAAEAGLERILVDFGLETDRGTRFALWSLLHMLGRAPDLAIAFDDPQDRDAARTFVDLLAGEL